MDAERTSVLCGTEEKYTERTEDAEKFRDELTGALIGLACTCMTNLKTEHTDRLIAEGLALTGNDECSDIERFRQMTVRIRQEKDLVAPGCAACAERCANTADYDMDRIRKADKEICSLKLQVLSAIRELAKEFSGGKIPEELSALFQRALFGLAQDWEKDQLQTMVTEVNEASVYRGQHGQ